jgi:hypothetical protein
VKEGEPQVYVSASFAAAGAAAAAAAAAAAGHRACVPWDA